MSKTADFYLRKRLQDSSSSFGASLPKKKHTTSLTMAFYRLIGYSISNSVTLYGLAPLYITDWHVLNESIQTALTETGTPCHSPTFTRNHLGGGFSPTELRPSGHSFLSASGKSATGFQYSSPNTRPT